MAKELKKLNINGEDYELSQVYSEMGLSFERFVELLERDYYCPTLSAAPTAYTRTYTDTDGSANDFQVGQPCRWLENGKYRMAFCKDLTDSEAVWYMLPAEAAEKEAVDELSETIGSLGGGVFVGDEEPRQEGVKLWIDESGQEEETDSTPKTVDLVMFIGQSNMAGRGVAAQAPAVPEGWGYEFKAISDPTKLYNLAEPFGVNENNSTSGVSEATKTGSMVSAFANSYYVYTGVPIVGVSCSKGGTNTDFWKVGGAPLNDAIARHSTARTWLLNNGYNIRHDFMVWCQGEADAKSDITDEGYTSAFKSIVEAMMGEGIEKCFVVRIGKYDGTAYSHDRIIALQTQICKTDKNAVLVSTDFAQMVELGLMKDEQHYLQEGYNIAGTNAGINTAYYIKNGKEPFMYDPEFDNLYVPYDIVLGNDIKLDNVVTKESENAVQNRAIAEAIETVSKSVSTSLSSMQAKIDEIELRMDAFESGSGTVSFVNVTYELSNVVSSMTSARTVKGKAFSTMLGAVPSYELGQVTVTMGSVDITSESYSDGVVNISEVTGDIVITASAVEVATIFNLDFTKKSLDDYIADGYVTKNGTISSVHTEEGDKFTVVDTANLLLGTPLTFPTSFEIYLRLKSGEDYDNGATVVDGGGGMALFNANGARPMINFRNPFNGSTYTDGMGLQWRLTSNTGDAVTIDNVRVPVRDNVFHDVVIHCENNNVWMSVDGRKSATKTSARNSSTVTHALGYATNYNFNNVTVACLKVYEV